MVTRITLGNAFESGGRTVVSGSNTGFDTQSLVDSLVTAKRLPAVQLEKKLELNASKLSAYGDLADLLSNFKDAANFLRRPPGFNTESEDVFQYRNSTLSTNTGTSASNYLDATVEPGAQLGTSDITVTTVATYNLKTTSTFALASLDTAVVGGALPFRSGLLTIGTGSRTVALSDGDTLQQVVDNINAVKDQNKVMATAIQVSPGNYRLQLKATETGTDLNYSTPGAALFPSGFAVEQDAVNASITVDSTVITSQSNTIADAIDGVTFTAKQATGGTHVSLEVEADTEIVKSAILNFVDAYNNLKLFNSRQTEVGEDGLPLTTSVLNNSSMLRNTISGVVNEMTSLVNGLSSPNTLADIGIAFDDFPGDNENPYTRNTLVVDEDKLDSALASNFDAVRKVFAFDYTSSNSSVQIFSRTNALDVTAFNLTLNITGGVYQASYLDGGAIATINLDASAITGGGTLLKGQAGTVLEGLQLIYSGSTDTTSAISVTQGIGDRIYNFVDDTTDLVDGALAIETNSITDADKRIEQEIVRIDEYIERYRQQLLDKFSRLESSLGIINNILASIDANTNARNSA